MQALPSEPESIIVLEMFGTETQSASTVHLNIGLQVCSSDVRVTATEAENNLGSNFRFVGFFGSQNQNIYISLY